MPQEQKPQEPTASFTAKAGLPGSPQPLEVKPLATDIKPWDLDQLPKFEHMGKARSRTEGPLKVPALASGLPSFATRLLVSVLLMPPIPVACP